MKFEPDKLEWTRSPKSYKIAEDGIEIVTAPNTDLWQRTYYHFRNDNAPIFYRYYPSYVKHKSRVAYLLAI